MPTFSSPALLLPHLPCFPSLNPANPTKSFKTQTQNSIISNTQSLLSPISMRIRGSPSTMVSSSYSSITDSSAPPTLSFCSSSTTSSFSIDSATRCDGLDLLIKAALHVAGSLLVVPFTQRRVIRRRRRKSSFEFSSLEFIKKFEEERAQVKGIEVILQDTKRRREMALPLKYHDSVLQPWKRRRRSVKVNRSMG